MPILDPNVAGDRFVDLLEAVARGGARWVEYRDKDAADELARTRAAALVVAGRRLGVDVLVNDRVEVARLTGAAGVHLGQDDMPAAAARQRLGPRALIGISVDTAAEARAAADLPVNYVAIGPIFPTASKPNAGPVVGLEGVRAAAVATDTPLVAVGGIDAGNAADVTAAGADCVAAISAFLAGDDVEAATRCLLAAARLGFERR